MAKWKRTLEVAAKIAIALWFAWWFSSFATLLVARILVFILLLILLAASVALQSFRGQRALTLKLWFAFVLACIFELSRLMRIFPQHHDESTLLLMLAIIPFLPLRLMWLHRPWWPAIRRTIRRARGGWSEDEERFVAEMSRPKK